MARSNHHQPKGGTMQQPNVTPVPHAGPSPHAPHVYVSSDLHPHETLVQWRIRQAQAKTTKRRVLASLLARPDKETK